jgi:hypothetical protein
MKHLTFNDMGKQLIEFDTVMAEMHHVCRCGDDTYKRYPSGKWYEFWAGATYPVQDLGKEFALEEAFRTYYRM